ncbi:RNA polymerase ECF-subfamily sigma factor [Alloactinosynnema sp. L-07]|uniref:RNA polymerase sigma factor n=1 Tax=Alloactinosynnema sp. L-07 TaxID=1653480 RepID=UPI00065EF613|nr:RNA polymerase sigma factor [Alloactinosynnema sp. L-07]CRK59388.1 RNA polymerase ECF-subfamily sigma factor [Alloactinosynnema sp. L-07]
MSGLIDCGTGQRDIDLDRPDLTSGDVTAVFARLFDTYANPLRGYLAGRVGADVADDIVADTFLVALRKRATYDPSAASVRAWLYGIAINLSRTHRRTEIRALRATARARGHSEEHTPADNDIAIADRVDAQNRVRGLAKALAALPDQDRDVLLLNSWAGLSPTEIALALGMPASSVRSKLHRVRHRLATLLTDKETRR